jgi:hypothetical protein
MRGEADDGGMLRRGHGSGEPVSGSGRGGYRRTTGGVVYLDGKGGSDWCCSVQFLARKSPGNGKLMGPFWAGAGAKKSHSKNLVRVLKEMRAQAHF